MHHDELAVAVQDPGPPPLSQIDSMDSYLRHYGKVLGHKAITSLTPLHVPEKDPLPDFSEMLREPFPPQMHVIAAATKMLELQGSGFLVGEMGCGKTLLGMCAVHKHAKGQPYRAIILCPDHLIAVWDEELRETIPGAIIHRFDDWKGFVQFMDNGHEILKETTNESGSVFRRKVKRWNKPLGPEWYIVGRNQAKWYPDWIGLSKEHRGFGGRKSTGHSFRHQIVDHVPVTDDDGRPTYDARGNQVKKAVIEKVYVCPRCGQAPVNKNGVMLGAKELTDKKKTCTGFYLESAPDADRKGDGKDRVLHYDGKLQDGKEVTVRNKKYIARKCGEPLWNFTSKPYRWAPARIIQKKLRRMFKYLIIDEVHEQKSDESAQSMASGKLMAATSHTLALTGTLIGGYARDMFPLMVRMTGKTLREEGFEWGKSLEFSKTYGRIDRIVTTKMDDGGDTSVGKRVVSMRKARTGKSTERMAVRPGIMPTMFGRHMIGTSLFITLEELADELPDLDEFVESGACDMDADLKAEYKRVESALVAANTELVQKGSMKLCGTLLQTLLAYPDMPYDWWGDHEGEDTVGYYEKPGDKTKENWRGVVSPADLGREAVRSKERKLIDICKAKKAQGKQVWVYVQMTGKRNVQPRLKGLLEKEGLRVGVLRSDTVDPKERKEWIDRNGPDFDVVISHPKLVSTGLTLFSKQQGGHNFSTIVFYETGYSLFDMRQAARRAWRIGQPHNCEVHYLYYRETMQHRAMQLMSRKMAAATALEGEFSTEGLVAMAGEDNAQMAMARSLSERIDDADMQRSWGKVKSGPKKVKAPVEAILSLTPDPVVLDSLDDLPSAIQLVAAATLDAQAEAVTIEVPDLSTFGRGGGPALQMYIPEPEAAADGGPMPMLSREQLARMFQSLLDNGMSLDDF